MSKNHTRYIAPVIFICCALSIHNAIEVHAATLGIVDSRILENLESIYPNLKSVTPVKGKSRRMADSVHGNSTLELIGEIDGVESVSIMSFLSADDFSKALLAYSSFEMLIRNMLPEWKEGSSWFRSIKPNESQETRVGDYEVSVSLASFKEGIDMVTLTIKCIE